ncbi:MAG: AbrB/MazE/SpoVT family DNA-binding domain-containing protein [Xanthomonadales bacterium]|nr:AbrB/MazE/SpoVT family DNA-binding domain-containing protein [Xanthomonadales bacterium]
MSTHRVVRLFRNGRNQALRIPREFELPGDSVLLRRQDGCLLIEPLDKGKLLDWLGTLAPLEEQLPDIDADLPALDEVDLD